MILTSGCTSHSFDMKNYEDSLFNLLVLPPPRGNVQESSTSVLGQVIESAVGIGTKIPPGVYAEYGTLLSFQGKREEAINAWGKEIEQYSDSSKSLEHRRSILIWPPFNQTDQPAVAAAFHSTISGPLIERGYYVFPIVATNVFLENLGLLEKQGIPASTLEQIQNEIGADAILTITITEWVKPKNFLGFNGQTVNLSAEYRLIEASSGNDLWRESFRNEVNERVTGGAVGPLVAVANDHRIPARVLNKQAIRSFSWESSLSSSSLPTVGSH